MADETLDLFVITSSSQGTSRTDRWGIVFTPYVSGIYQIIMTKDSLCTATRCYLYEVLTNGKGIIISDTNFVGDTATLSCQLSPNKQYYVVVDANGSTYTVRRQVSGFSYPHSNSHILLTACVIINAGSYTNAIDVFTNIRTVKREETGTAGSRWLKSDYPDTDRTTPLNLIPEEDLTEMDKTGIW